MSKYNNKGIENDLEVGTKIIFKKLNRGFRSIKEVRTFYINRHMEKFFQNNNVATIREIQRNEHNQEITKILIKENDYAYSPLWIERICS